MKNRGSYSKTDPDATFMRDKKNELKACYNVQISTTDQYITNYTISQNPSDTRSLPDLLANYESDYSIIPKNIVADAAYGSEENYELIENLGSNAYVKYNRFYAESKNIIEKNKPFDASLLYYNKDKNCYYCPIGQEMKFVEQIEEETKYGFKKQISCYEAKNCEGCPLRGMCFKRNGNRRIRVNHNLNNLKKQANILLKSEKGRELRSKRCVDVETSFGNIKQNKGFVRFSLRGLEKVNLEFGLLAIAHNVKKYFLKIKRIKLAQKESFSLN